MAGHGHNGKGAKMKTKVKAIVIHPKDTVATALEQLKTGVEVIVTIDDRAEKIRLVSDIPMGHKFALLDMEKGAAVIKYGEAIGQSTAKITRGEYVHVHNVVSPAHTHEGGLS